MTTLTLTGLPAHSSVSLSFLLAVIDSWDGGSGGYSPDILNVSVDGNTIFSESFSSNDDSQPASYPNDSTPPAVVLAYQLPLGFGDEPVSWLDSAYDMGAEPRFQNIPHTSSTLTIEWYAGGGGWQGDDDESWAIDNVTVSIDTEGTVFTTDFDSGVPPEFSGVTTTEGVQGFAGLGNDSNVFGGVFLRNTATLLPPSNDAFADAVAVTSFPFSDLAVMRSATTEEGEPLPSCGYWFLHGSVWYAFTPTTSELVTASGSTYDAEMAVYTGTGLSDLSEVGCAAFGSSLTFAAQAGTTYYFQVGSIFDDSVGAYTFSLDRAPPPQASFWSSPSDPSVFDTVQFYDQSYDPAGIGVQSESWDFGDGTIATGYSPTHRYAKDGDYTVELDVTTYDGRTASTTQVLAIRTHDVAILFLHAPNKGKIGKPGVFSVGIGNTRYPEMVQVDLYKVMPQGDVLVGTKTQPVAAMKLNKTVTFSFSYVFTSDDALVGKVPFKAVATIQGARDAVGGDNVAISPSTLITK